MSKRQYTLVDRILGEVDTALRTLSTDLPAHRNNPASEMNDVEMNANDSRHSAGLMRVNHSGEVCAQALYRGQLVAARDDETATMLSRACDEEVDHLAWTHERLRELQSHRSFLNPLWYMNAFMIGVVASMAGDRWSLGFVEETERQVGDHLQGHLGKLPEADSKSRAIVEQMHEDETHHGAAAHNAGARELPSVVKQLMQLHAKVMTTLSYYL